jgi:ABC-type transport system substrate-binding protein
MARETGVDAFCADRLSLAGSLRYGIDQKLSLDKIKKYVPKAVIRLKPVGAMRGLMFNVAGVKGRKGPWQDIMVRRAMTLVTDFPGSIMVVQGSLDLGISSGLVPPHVPTGLSWKEVEKVLGIDKPMDQRIQEAKKLMKEAGYPNGFRAELICRGGRTGGVYLPAAEFLIESWRKNLNIQVDVRPLESAILFPRRDTGDFDLMYDGMTSRYGGGAPEETLYFFTSHALENHGKWSNPEYDRLYGELIRETDPKKKQEMSVKMQRIFLTEIPFMINVTAVVGTAYRPTLHGHVMQPGHTGWACIDRIWMKR